MRLVFVEKDRAEDIARLALNLLEEVQARTGRKIDAPNLAQTTRLCKNFLAKGQYNVVAACAGDVIVGFGSLCESHALYAEGTFGILQELYVLPEYRSQGVGAKLLEKIVEFARKKGWRRLELATPPLPEFDGSVRFYEKNGFELTSGRKLRRLIDG
ncbi:MAG: GNAT family N-acetyltransferase [Gammaproteobacteria bacterium]|jgi:GNAT superfamily N-acetyltransferase|nr:MAG: GNAT family N-acetyltransferase [Gammaproteobacteria bacterium]